MKHLRNNPERNYFIFYLLAGHGMIVNGSQAVLLNQFDKSPTFYKIWAVEADIRDIAIRYSNSYQVALFACCREIMNREKHSGGMTHEDAKEFQCLYNRRKQMMPILGEQVRLHFEGMLDQQKLKLLAIRADFI